MEELVPINNSSMKALKFAIHRYVESLISIFKFHREMLTDQVNKSLKHLTRVLCERVSVGMCSFLVDLRTLLSFRQILDYDKARNHRCYQIL